MGFFDSIAEKPATPTTSALSSADELIITDTANGDIVSEVSFQPASNEGGILGMTQLSSEEVGNTAVEMFADPVKEPVQDAVVPAVSSDLVITEEPAKDPVVSDIAASSMIAKSAAFSSATSDSSASSDDSDVAPEEILARAISELEATAERNQKKADAAFGREADLKSEKEAKTLAFEEEMKRLDDAMKAEHESGVEIQNSGKRTIEMVEVLRAEAKKVAR